MLCCMMLTMLVTMLHYIVLYHSAYIISGYTALHPNIMISYIVFYVLDKIAHAILYCVTL